MYVFTVLIASQLVVHKSRILPVDKFRSQAATRSQLSRHDVGAEFVRSCEIHALPHLAILNSVYIQQLDYNSSETSLIRIAPVQVDRCRALSKFSRPVDA